MSDYQARISNTADGDVYAMVVRVDRDGADEAIPTWAKKMGVCIQYPEFGGN